MAITVVTRPEKTLSNGFLSTWNSSELPLRFKFENDLYPINKVDTIEDIQGVAYAPDKQGTSITFLFSPQIVWSLNTFVEITNTGTDLDGGFYKIKEFDGNFDMILDVYTEDTSSTGNCQKFYRNYTGLVKVFAGARDGHPYNLDGSKPLQEIGTIEVDFKEENGDNIGYANVKSFVKPDITSDFDYEHENSHFGWSSFHIQTAESYDDVVNGNIQNVTTDFVDDEQENCLPFTGFEDSNFNNGLSDWSQESWVGGSDTWSANTGFIESTTTLGTNIVYQNIQIYKDVLYTFDIDFDLTLTSGNSILVIVFGKNSVGTWNEIAQSSISSAGNNNISLDISSNSDYENIGIAFRGLGATINFSIDLNSLQASTDVAQPCLYFNYALYGCKQFQDDLGGNFGDYVLNKVDTLTPKLLTHFDELSYFYDKPFYLNGVISSSLFSQSEDGDNVFLSVDVFDESDNSLLSYNYKIDNYGDGVYTVDPDLKTQLDINNISSCDWKYAKVGFIIIPANLFVDGDNGTFESGVSGIDILNSTPNDIGVDITQVNRGRSDDYSGFVSWSSFSMNETDKEYSIFRNQTLLSVVEGLEYEITGYISTTKLSNNYDPHIDNGVLYFLPNGYSFEECSVSVFDIKTSNFYSQFTPITFDDWKITKTIFTAKATEDIYVVFHEKISNNINTFSEFQISIDDITFKGPIEYISENKTVKNQCSCSPYGVNLRWKNDLGGWDNWYFDKESIYSENVTGKVNIKRDITSNWDDTFINGDTQNDTIKTNANKSILVRSQFLTKNEQEVLQQIRRSVRVQLLTDNNKWQTVTINQSKFVINEEGDKTRDISFEINLPDIVIQEQ